MWTSAARLILNKAAMKMKHADVKRSVDELKAALGRS
jgi:hypothetical protein